MTTATNVRIEDASREHIPFIAWVINAANRSHVPRSMWDFILGDDEARVLAYLEVLSQTEQKHWASWELVLVAEVDGQPAAALCGFFENELPAALLMAGAFEAEPKAGVSGEEFAAGWERARSITAIAAIEHQPGAWVLEHVATRPEYRGQGLMERLIEDMMERGRERGATTADIGVLIGNDPAQRRYEKSGFGVVQEIRDAEFEAVYGTPGARMLRRAL